ncbi:hypothetical protein N9Y92_04670 [Chlamydiales bacterium]|nr:hypothetical protein [Chlamydiales bacterium]
MRLRNYFFSLVFIFGWWGFFYPEKREICIEEERVKPSLPFEPIDRNSLVAGLRGDWGEVERLIALWSMEADTLKSYGLSDIQQLSPKEFKEAIQLSKWIQSAHYQPPQKKILPQTYVSATILLACASEDQLVALPQGLRSQEELFPKSKTSKIVVNCHELNAETIYQTKPNLAFVASYSNPTFLKTLDLLQIPRSATDQINTVEDVYQTIEEVGRQSAYPYQGRLLSLFVKGALFASENRLIMVTPGKNLEILYLTYGNPYHLPSPNTLLGSLLQRLKINAFVESKNSFWEIPITLEEIKEKNPHALIFSNNRAPLPSLKKYPIYSVSEVVQNSPTQFIALAHRDLCACLMEMYQL